MLSMALEDATRYLRVGGLFQAGSGTSVNAKVMGNGEGRRRPERMRVPHVVHALAYPEQLEVRSGHAMST